MPELDRDAHLADFADFIRESPSSYHAAASVAARLEAAGFERLEERDEWPSGPGRRVVVRDGAVIAWVQPDGAAATTPFRILGAHTDSPSFKLKPGASTSSEGLLQAGVEVYGGPLLNSWLDRELELAGRLVTEDGTEHLVRTGPLLRIPQLAIHLDREVNKGLTLDRQRHLQPVWGAGSGHDVLGHLAGIAGLHAEDVAGHDVLLADTAAPARFGRDDELFAAGRMDNLSSVHAGLVALLAAPDAASRSSGRSRGRARAAPSSRTCSRASPRGWARLRATGGARSPTRGCCRPTPGTRCTRTTPRSTTRATGPCSAAVRC